MPNFNDLDFIDYFGTCPFCCAREFHMSFCKYDGEVGMEPAEETLEPLTDDYFEEETYDDDGDGDYDENDE